MLCKTNKGKRYRMLVKNTEIFNLVMRKGLIEVSTGFRKVKE